jgi:hypothetical protein
MEKSKEKASSTVAKPRMGRPPQTEKKGIEMSIEGDYVVIKVPRKDLTKKLLAELI